MTPEQDDYLRRNFSGDMPGIDADPSVVYDAPRVGRYTAPPPTVSPVTTERFYRVMQQLEPPPSPVAVSVPTRRYLLEDPTNAQLWLRDAEDVEADVRLGVRVDAAQATRLLLEAIPVVRQLVT